MLSTTIVPLGGVRDLVFDGNRDLLYAVAYQGTVVVRYDPASNQLLSPLVPSVLGTYLNGLDITPDGSALFGAGAVNSTPSLIRFDLDTGASTAHNFGTLGRVGTDIAVADSGRGLISTTGPTFTRVPLWEFDVASGVPIVRDDPAGGVYPNAVLARSADHSTVLAQEQTFGFSAGLVSIYDADADAFSQRLDVNEQVAGRGVVSPDGSLFALPMPNDASVVVFDRSFDTVKTLPGLQFGQAAVFSPDGAVLYGVNGFTDELVGYDTRTWREKFRLPLGVDVMSTSPRGIAVSDDGTKLFVAAQESMWAIDLPQATGQATRFELSPVQRLGPAGMELNFTVTALDPAGEIAGGYRGTVRLSSTDPATVLPTEYTFTETNGGVATFTVNLNTPGVHTITVADDSTPSLTATSPTIAVHAGTASFAPVTGGRELVYDPVRDLLYVTTAGGTVERLDPAAGVLLPAVQVGSPLNGADITADGSALYAADAVRGLLAGYVQKINLTDLSVEPLSYADTVQPNEHDSGAWDVAIAGNGKALVTLGAYTGTTYAVRELELDTGEFAVRRDPPWFQPLTGGTLSGQSSVARSADRSGVLLLPPSNYAFTYNAASDSVAHRGEFSSPFDRPPVAVSRDGALYASAAAPRGHPEYTLVYSQDFRLIATLTGAGGAVAFDPVRDTLYAVDTAADEIVAYDTTTWRERYRVPVGADVGPPAQSSLGPGSMVASADGTTLFLLTPEGVRVIGAQRQDPRVVGRHVFYNHSGFDGGDAAANAADDSAIATDKAALLAGQERLPGFDNVTSYAKGINGMMVDIANLPQNAALTAADFDFGGALRPREVTVRRGAGTGGSDRVTLVWTDYSPGQETATMATANGWLTVTVLANERTGLSQPDVFSFGNLIGETGDDPAAFRVSALDLAAVKRNLNRSTPVTSPTDFDRDGRTSALDVAAVKRALNRALTLLPAITPASDTGTFSARSVAEELGLVGQ